MRRSCNCDLPSHTWVIEELLQGRCAAYHAQSRWVYPRGLVGHKAHATLLSLATSTPLSLAPSRCPTPLPLTVLPLTVLYLTPLPLTYGLSMSLTLLTNTSSTPPRCTHACSANPVGGILQV